MVLEAPQDTTGPSTLLAALPEPKRARKEAFLKNEAESIVGRACRSMDNRHKAKAAMLAAEEAIPLLCGKEFWDCMEK